VTQGGAVDAFQAAGIRTVDTQEALSQAMIDLIGAPLLTEALGSTGERVILDLPVGSGLDQRRIRDLALAGGVLILLVERHGEDLVPHGNTVLQRGDRMLLFGRAEAVHQAREQLMAIE
jgi:Trk K+ transport system NAD-binding subunit